MMHLENLINKFSIQHILKYKSLIIQIFDLKIEILISQSS